MAQNSQQEDAASAIIPQITNEETDKIIDHFNQQFEEKVMKKVKTSEVAQVAPPTIQEVESAVSAAALGPDRERGADLQDYLQTVRAELPNVPFADEDSKIDLSKLLDKRSHV